MSPSNDSAAEPPPPRTARLVLVTPDGTLVGSLPAVSVETPWWQDARPVVAAIRQRYGIDVTVLRLLDTGRDHPHGGPVTYLAEVAKSVPAEPWTGPLDDHPLRQPYARPGGPAADLAWARSVLAARGMHAREPAVQVRTWNLSSLWQIPTDAGAAWLKVVPPFFAHEGRLLEALAGENVPTVLGRDGGRMLLAEVPGKDMYEAGDADLLAMVSQLSGLQHTWLGRAGELLALGLIDWRAPALNSAIAGIVDTAGAELADDDRMALDRFVAGLPGRFAAIDAFGLGDTLVHGDFHPGNVRGDGSRLTILDWADSGVGNPLLDQPAFLDRVPKAMRETVRGRWSNAWRGRVPGSDPEHAAELIAPVAAARQAVVYQRFLDAIEPSEQVYHRHDPAEWLARTAALVRDEAF